MPNIYKLIGQTIRDLRGTAMSQETLAKELKIKPNTLSRWETGTYKPGAEDLDKIARFFKVPISVFFTDQTDTDERVAALTSAIGGLNDKDFEEVIRYAEFRKMPKMLKKQK